MAHMKLIGIVEIMSNAYSRLTLSEKSCRLPRTLRLHIIIRRHSGNIPELTLDCTTASAGLLSISRLSHYLILDKDAAFNKIPYSILDCFKSRNSKHLVAQLKNLIVVNL